MSDGYVVKMRQSAGGWTQLITTDRGIIEAKEKKFTSQRTISTFHSLRDRKLPADRDLAK